MEKNMDIIVANDVSIESIGFNSDYNAVKLIKRDGSVLDVPKSLKYDVAHIILNELAKLFEV